MPVEGKGSKWIQRLFKVMHLAAFLALMVMMLMVVANIVGRIFFRKPIMGTLEVAGFCGVIVVAFAVAFAQREGRNIYVDLVVQRFSTGLRAIIDSFTYLLSMVAVGIVAWAVFASAVEAYMDQDITLTLSVATYPFRFTWALGLLILFLFLIQHVIGTLRRGGKR
jgi:TRAP-type C4-dicarboxylate transport system permease small subunit